MMSVCIEILSQTQTQTEKISCMMKKMIGLWIELRAREIIGYSFLDGDMSDA